MKYRYLYCCTLFVISLWGCQDFGAKSAIPSDVIDPSLFRTAEGANQLALRAKMEFQHAVQLAVVIGGLFGDELSVVDPLLKGDFYAGDIAVDRRVNESSDNSTGYQAYRQLHIARGYSEYAFASLEKYDSSVSGDLLSELLIIQAYTKVLLGELFCSGIPMSKLVLEGDYIYSPGSTTQEVFASAAELFDSAIVLADNNAQIRNLGLLGKARSLLSLGQFDIARQAVTAIDKEYQHSILGIFDRNAESFGAFYNLTVSDREGGRGFPYVTGDDPRIELVVRPPDISQPSPAYHPAKYRNSWVKPVKMMIASGIEARLVEAEALLNDGAISEWLNILNELRNDIGLPPIADPGESSSRLDTHFNERAAWLFLTGHRQGDLRRLVRVYGIPITEVYPSGIYQNTFLQYGAFADLQVPAPESLNPYFEGCEARDA